MDKISGVGLGHLEYGKFRQNRQGEYVVAVSNEDEIKVKTLTITESGNTAFIPAEAGKAIRVRGIIYSREGGGAAAISLREDSDGDLKYTVYLKDDGDKFEKDLSHVWALNTNKPLYIYASGACNVHVTVEYDGPDESVQEGETLADTLSITEALSIKPNKKVADALAMTDDGINKFAIGAGKGESLSVLESIAKVSSTVLADSLSITESISAGLVAEAEIKALSDSLSISEALGNGLSLKLSDAVSIETTDMEREYVNNP